MMWRAVRRFRRCGSKNMRRHRDRPSEKRRQLDEQSRSLTVTESVNDSGARAPPRVTRRPVDDKLVIGRLTEHGRAKYQFRPHENDSYYVLVLSSRGLKTLWA